MFNYFDNVKTSLLPSTWAGYFAYLGVGVSCMSFFIRRSIKSRVIYCKCVQSSVNSHSRKVAVITGATSGLGRALAMELGTRNWTVLFGFRNQMRANQLQQEIQKISGVSNVQPFHLELSDPNSIKTFVANVNSYLQRRKCEDGGSAVETPRIDALILNAGMFAGHFIANKQFNMEETMLVNHLANVMLMNEFQKLWQDQKLETSLQSPTRIIFVNSALCKSGKLNLDRLDFSGHDAFTPRHAYVNSKLALCLYARKLHRLLNHSTPAATSTAEEETTVELSVEHQEQFAVFSLFTGGMVNTGLFEAHYLRTYNFLVRKLAALLCTLLLRTPTQGCQTMLHLATCPAEQLPRSDSLLQPATLSNAASVTRGGGGGEGGAGGEQCRASTVLEWPDACRDEVLMEQLYQKSQRIIQETTKSD